MTQLEAATADAPVEVTDDGPRLVAGRCATCIAVSFPIRERCPACDADLERIHLPAQGTLWTWTTQGFPPKSPPYVPGPGEGEFVPFAVGYVELAGFLRVEGRLTESDPERLRIGMSMEVVALPRGDTLGYAFAPVDDPGTSA